MGLTRRLCIALLVGAAFAACDLNPQPLPPGDDGQEKATAPNPQDPGSGFGGGGPNNDGSPTGGDAGATNDGSPPPKPDDGGTDATVDSGDAGDATTD